MTTTVRNDRKITGRGVSVGDRCDEGNKFYFTALDIQAAIVKRFNHDYSMGRIYKGISAALKLHRIFKADHKSPEGLTLYWK